jgi:hypothetical protein
VPVIYSKTRPQFTGNPAELTPEFARRWLSTKYKDWYYEDEVRVFVKLDPAEERAGLYYYNFCPRLQLKEVIIGTLCDVSAGLRAKINMHAGGLEILKARLAFKSFKVVKDQRGF